MRVVHEAEDPGAPVDEGLFEAVQHAGSFFALSGVRGDAGVGELALLRREPAGVEGVVGEEKERDEGDTDGEGALDDEEPGTESVSKAVARKNDV